MTAMVSDGDGAARCCECGVLTARPVRVSMLHGGRSAEFDACGDCAGLVARGRHLACFLDAAVREARDAREGER